MIYRRVVKGDVFTEYYPILLVSLNCFRNGDSFSRQYTYDAAGRLEKVIDPATGNPDAKYTYWPDGQLKRMELNALVLIF